MTEDEIRDLVRQRARPYAVTRAGSTGVTAWGASLGLSRGGLSRFMTGERRAGVDLLNALGLEWRIVRNSSAWVGGGETALTEDEVRNLVQKRAAALADMRWGSTGIMSWADAHGIHKGALSLFMTGKRPPGADTLSALDLERCIVRQPAARGTVVVGARKVRPRPGRS